MSAILTTSVYATAAALVTWGVYEANHYIDKRASHQAFINTINYASQTYSNSRPDPKKRRQEEVVDPSERPPGVPGDWERVPSDKKGGYKWIDPGNPHNSVRQMPGNPKSPNPAQQRPYVVRMRDGRAVNPNNLPVPKNAPEAHIPAEQFVFQG